MVTTENENYVLIEEAGGGLRARLMEFECRRVRIVPLVSFDIVVLAAVQLGLLVPIVATKRVDVAAVVHSREESLFLRHLRLNLQLAVLIDQISVSG